MQITIRPIEEKEFPAIIELFREFATFEKRPEKMTNSVERLQREKEHFHCFVAVDATDRIIGYATYFFSYHTWTGKCLHMDDLYVKPDFRGMGIGQRLLDEVIALAKDSACHKVRWQVSDWNTPAQEFYKKLGAEITNGEWNCDLWLQDEQ
jgi:ribosomal protein S18 acetylase RimI-like enzyme